MANFQKTPLPLTDRSSGLAFSAMIIAYMIFSVLIQAVFIALSVTGGVLFTVVNALASPLAIITVLIFSMVYSREKISCALSVKGCSPVYFLIAVMIAAGMFFGLGFVNIAISGWLTKMGVAQSTVTLDFDGVGSLLLFTLSLAIIPAVTEELFFRGLMFNSLSGVKLWQGVLFVSACFALYHCSAAQLVYQLIYGAALCLLTYAAKSVLPGITAHFLNNFAVIILTYLGVNIDFYNAFVILGGLVLFALGTAWMVALIRKNKAETQTKGGSRLWWLTGTLGGAVCLVLIIGNLLIGA